MEKVAATGKRAGSRWEQSLQACTAVLLAAGAVSPAAGAQEAAPPAGAVLVAEARADEPAMRVQVRTSTLPRLEAQDGGFQAPRVDLSVTPFNSSGTGVGAVLGMSGFNPNATGMGLQPQRANVDLGLRWTHLLQSQRQIDVTAWRRMNTPDDAYTLVQMRQPVYGARVEMNLSSAKKGGFALERGFIGMQLESGARISIKRKDGRPMIYYRTSF
jgi:hypothetical protein